MSPRIQTNRVTRPTSYSALDDLPLGAVVHYHWGGEVHRIERNNDRTWGDERWTSAKLWLRGPFYTDDVGGPRPRLRITEIDGEPHYTPVTPNGTLLGTGAWTAGEAAAFGYILPEYDDADE